MLDLPDSGNKAMHYVFATSQNDSSTDPVVLWLTGGPGCSSLEAFSYENGPFFFPEGQKYLVKNEQSWNNYANMLWFESPPGVGFSSFGDKQNAYTDDTQTANDNLAALIQFFKAYPEFRKNKFYIAGESYGGVYVPYIATWVMNYTKSAAEEDKINLHGFLVGNGVASVEFDDSNANTAEFAWWHALYG
jgi:carboxypeptidase C (cathepsin A)